MRSKLSITDVVIGVVSLVFIIAVSPVIALLSRPHEHLSELVVDPELLEDDAGVDVDLYR